jgi:hypothetical protein
MTYEETNEEEGSIDDPTQLPVSYCTSGGSELTRKASEKADRTAVFVSPSGRAAKSLYPAAEVGTWNSVPYPGICSNRDLISEFKIAVNTARPIISSYFCL